MIVSSGLRFYGSSFTVRLSLCPHNLNFKWEPLSWRQFAQKAKQTIENRQGVRWTTGNIQIDRHNTVCTVVNFGMIDIGTACNRTRADRDDNFRRWNRVV